MTSGELITPSDARWGAVLRQIRHDVYHTQAYVQADGVRLDALPTAFVVAEGDRLFFLPLRSLAICRRRSTTGVEPLSMWCRPTAIRESC